MGRIIRFEPDRHRETQTLLPWYVTGQLQDEERARVDAHLRDCPECQAELRLERRLAGAVAELPFEADHSWSELSRRIAAEGEPRPGPLARMRRALAAPGRAGWAIAAQFVIVVAGLSLVLPFARAPGSKSPSAPPPAYHALGAARPQPAGDVIVVFQPQAKSADLTRALRDSGARLVDGPTAADAYVLDVPLAQRRAALARLRADSAVSLAEPVDPTERP
jgi:anti-sigma factor RsiW